MQNSRQHEHAVHRNRGYRPGHGAEDYASRPDSWPRRNNFRKIMMYLDRFNYLTGEMLNKVDRLSMTVSLGSKAFFMKHCLIEFSWPLPLGAKQAVRADYRGAAPVPWSPRLTAPVRPPEAWLQRSDQAMACRAFKGLPRSSAERDAVALRWYPGPQSPYTTSGANDFRTAADFQWWRVLMSLTSSLVEASKI